MKLKLLILSITLACFQHRASAGISIRRDISYSTRPAPDRGNLLDVYYPKDKTQPSDVMVFIHGGSWNSGKKESYWWLGRNMARKNVVTVIINYSLSPIHQYEKMVADCAEALKWVSVNINDYGGDVKRIFVMGHSSGGHLAALINSDPRFFKQQKIRNPIHGLILNDAFGLDMFEYLNAAEDNGQTNSFLNTFSRDTEMWKTGSPLNYLENVNNPYLIFAGERTYPAIKIQSERLHKGLLATNKKTEFRIIPRKKHIGMISQMFFKGNSLYAYILDFMKTY
ncbi:MAG: alpha/beta hydrolase [Daejeonella sp.]